MLKAIKTIALKIMGAEPEKRDFFEPSTLPALSIYKAFRKESMKRAGRVETEWREAEITAVHDEALVQAQKHGLCAISRDQVIRAERYAVGSADYGAKWAYKVVDAMHADHDRCANRNAG